jgi:hypothetical protein
MLSEPLSYHLKIRDYFKRQPGIWAFFSASRKKEEQLASFKSELLKNTYQFHPASDPNLYEKINIIQDRLGLGHLRVTAYQAAHSSELNASIVCLRDEAHMVFSGNILELLNEEELSALIAHELAHIKFCSLMNGELEIADRIITVLAGSPDGSASHYETARLFRLYKEIYCDREAYNIRNEAGPVITMLLKLTTGLSTVHAENYIRQAEEIFSGEGVIQSASLTHPENYIRTRALHLWHESSKEGKPPAEDAIAQMIEGIRQLDRLDVLAQKELSDLTRALLEAYLHPEWVQTTVVTALACQYFPDLGTANGAGPGWKGAENGAVFPDQLKNFLTNAHQSIQEYFAYVLLDLALADPDLEDVPLGHARELAEMIGLSSVLEPIVKKETTYGDNAR